MRFIGRRGFEMNMEAIIVFLTLALLLIVAYAIYSSMQGEGWKLFAFLKGFG